MKGQGKPNGKGYERTYLEEPLSIKLIWKLVVEELRAPTEHVAPLPICQAPSYSPVGHTTNEGIKHILD